MTENTAVTLNLGLPNLSTVVYAKQNDRLARKITATLVDGSAAWTPPAGSAAIIRYLKPDGTGGFYDVDENEDPAISISGNVATLTLAEQALTVPGNVYMELNFYTGSNEKVTTFTWLLAVKPSVLTDATIVSSDYYNVLTAEIAALLGATTHPPIIDSVSKDWLLWNEHTGQYEDSGYSSVGTTGPAPTVTSTSYEYQNSSSGTTIPTGTWSSTVPTTPQGSFRWTKVTATFDNNTTSTWYSCSYMGVDGQGSPGSATPLMDGVAATGTANAYSREDHVHPSDTAKLDASYAPIRFTGTISSFPFVITDASIIAGMEPVSISLGTPTAVTTDIGWTVAAGSLTLTGTLATSGSTTVEIILAKTDNAASSGTIIKSTWAIRTFSLVTSATVASSGTTALNTYSSRKFSDYDLIIFKCGTSSSEWRVSQTLPSSQWKSGASVYLTGVHGSSLENRSGVSFSYSSDTSANASLTGSGAFNEVQIFGVKIA